VGPVDFGYYTYGFGQATTFASSTTLENAGTLDFEYGPGDGSLGALPLGGGNYKFFGAGAQKPCEPAGTYIFGCQDEGVFSLTGTFTGVTQTTADSFTPLFGKGAANSGHAPGWNFDRDYAGGGQVVPYTATWYLYEFGGGREAFSSSGLLMPYHGEYHYDPSCDPSTTPGCQSNYYAGMGLAVGSSDGTSFESFGQIVQMYPPRAQYDYAGAPNVGNSFGSFVVADASGNHLANPPPSGSDAYLYLFYQDVDPNAGTTGDANPAICVHSCMAVARASYASVMETLTPAFIDPIVPSVQTLFHKYYVDPTTGAGTWTQPGTTDAGEDEWSGKFTALMPDVVATMVSVLYDQTSDEYLAAFQASPSPDQTFDNSQICIRTSPDLIHWSPTSTPGTTPQCATFFQTAAGYGKPGGGTGTTLLHHTEIYPTLIGETGDPLVGGPAPRVFFQDFEAHDNNPSLDTFPSPWSTYHYGLESTPVNVTFHRL
jgi:hypothetical protein